MDTNERAFFGFRRKASGNSGLRQSLLYGKDGSRNLRFMANLSTPEPNVLVLEGEIDLSASPAIKEQFRQMLADKPDRIYVDLSGVPYIDSSGLAALIEAMQRLHSYGGTLALYGLRSNVSHILHIARLDQVFRIFPDRATAVAELE